MIRRIFTLVALVAATGANAQTPTRKGSSSTSSYCLPASAAFLENEEKVFEEIRKCNRGDTIVIPARSASAVARLCDLTKAVVAAGDNVVCAIVLPERESK